MRKGAETRRVARRHRRRPLTLVTAHAPGVTAAPARTTTYINTAEYRVPKGEHVVTSQATDGAGDEDPAPRAARSR